MSEEARAQPAPSATDREAVMSALGDAYAADQLELDELERRMAAVYRATSHDALRDVLQGLGRAPLVAPERGAQPRAAGFDGADGMPPAHLTQRALDMGYARIARPDAVQPRAVVAAMFGGAVRKGSWVVPRQIKAIAVMGGVELDFREAQFADGVTELECYALMGGVDIKLPLGVRVEINGGGVMGGFSVSTDDADPGPDAPVLRISGFALMGGVDAKLKRFGKKEGKRRREGWDDGRDDG